MKPIRRSSKKKKKRRLVRALGWAVLAVFALHAVWAAALIGLRFINPPTTGVQIQRRIESIFGRAKYEKRQRFVPLSRISPDLQHAVIASEDGRFYEHNGIDWRQVRKVAEDSFETGEVARGASTITQQLVKNLFFTTHRNPVRKAAEYTLAPLADVILGKQRTLELYLNAAEWGPGVFGAEAAAGYHYQTSASRLSRDQAARLAAILPSPVRRNPGRMDATGSNIQNRMRQMGW